MLGNDEDNYHQLNLNNSIKDSYAEEQFGGRNQRSQTSYTSDSNLDQALAQKEDIADNDNTMRNLMPNFLMPKLDKKH